MIAAFVVLLSAYLVAATVTIEDPSDTINPNDWASDNAILADYNVAPVMYQFIPVVGPYTYNSSGSAVTVSHQTLSVDQNDTSVVVITDGNNVNMNDIDIIKFGYASNLLQSSFFG